MNFGKALEFIKLGEKLYRTGWNGKDIFIYYVPANNFITMTDVARKEFGNIAIYNPYIALRNRDNTVSPWAPSISDCLAEDWEVMI